jgi:CAAX protease family protein
MRNQSVPWVLTLFVLLIGVSLLIAAALSPLVQKALSTLQVFPLHRVFNRIAMLAFLLGAWALFRQQNLTNREALGYGAPPRVFLGNVAAGFAAGLVLMIAVCAVLVALQVRIVRPEYADSLFGIVSAIPAALVAGFTVALIEETFFRGAMFSALSRQDRWISAAVLTSVLYSLVHFVGEKVRIAPEDVTWSSGWLILGRYFSAFADPARIADAALALFLVGLLLALIRRVTGHIGACIGLHAGFVAVIALFREATAPEFDGNWSFLVSRFDGLVGYLVAVAAALCCLGFCLRYSRQLRGAGGG